MKRFPVLPRYLSPTLEHRLRYIYQHCDHCIRCTPNIKDYHGPGHAASCSHVGCQVSYPRKNEGVAA